MPEYKIYDIKKAYWQKKDWEKQFPINYYLIRPFSFYLTLYILKITQNPAKVAMVGFTTGILGCFFLACAPLTSLWPGILLILLYSISDAVDGNVARTTDNVTVYGKYLDGIYGSIIDASYFLFLGIGIYLSDTVIESHILSITFRDHAKVIPLFLGSFIVITKLWSDVFKSRHDIYTLGQEELHMHDKFDMSAKIGKSKYSNKALYRIFINIDCLNNQLILLIIFTIFNLEVWFLLFFSLFFLIKAVLYFFFFFKRTKSIIRP